jgi:hypothetical protein
MPRLLVEMPLQRVVRSIIIFVGLTLSPCRCSAATGTLTSSSVRCHLSGLCVRVPGLRQSETTRSKVLLPKRPGSSINQVQVTLRLRFSQPFSPAWRQPRMDLMTNFTPAGFDRCGSTCRGESSLERIGLSFISRLVVSCHCTTDAYLQIVTNVRSTLHKVYTTHNSCQYCLWKADYALSKLRYNGRVAIFYLNLCLCGP